MTWPPLGSPSAAIARHDRAAFRDVTYRQVETLTELMEAYQPSTVERMQERLLEVTAEDEPLLRQLLGFVAVLPGPRFDRSRRTVTHALREPARLLRQAQRQRRGLRARLLALAAWTMGLAFCALLLRLVGTSGRKEH
ncbi:MAG TPA: hypothetical protein VNP04_22095 [Alphaproteobacteria bacterium]|nr:hypothetical protein [Alphaproteobacteria bacterium]